jgi:P27 family predicted phage terminase small subunit
MKRGRVKTPTAFAILKGNPSKLNLTARLAVEPKPIDTPAGHDPPEGLDGVALQKWRESVPMLQTMRVWGTEQRDTWTRYCQIFSLWKTAYTKVSAEGATYFANGLWRTRPEAVLARQYAKDLLTIEQQFGITPSAKASVSVQAETEAPAIRTFLEGTA